MNPIALYTSPCLTSLDASCLPSAENVTSSCPSAIRVDRVDPGVKVYDLAVSGELKRSLKDGTSVTWIGKIFDRILGLSQEQNVICQSKEYAGQAQALSYHFTCTVKIDEAVNRFAPCGCGLEQVMCPSEKSVARSAIDPQKYSNTTQQTFDVKVGGNLVKVIFQSLHNPFPQGLIFNGPINRDYVEFEAEQAQYCRRNAGFYSILAVAATVSLTIFYTVMCSMKKRKPAADLEKQPLFQQQV